MSYSKKQFTNDSKGLKFTGNSKELAFLVASADFSKAELYTFLNAFKTQQEQVQAINDYLAVYKEHKSFKKKIADLKQWSSRMVDSLGTPRVVLIDSEDKQVSWAGGVLSLNDKDGRDGSNGVKTEAAKAKAAKAKAAKKAKEAKALADKKAKEAKALADKKAKEAKALADKKAKEAKAENQRLLQELELVKSKKTVKPVSETDTPPTVDSVSEAINDNQIIVDFDNLAALSDDTVLILFNAMSNELTLRALEQKQA